LAALGGVAWVMFTLRPVELQVEPPPDHLAIEGGLVDWKLGGRHILRTGTYTVVAEKAGYRRLAAPIEVTRDTQQSFHFQLEQLPGLLAIDTGGVAGAEVLIDGAPAGVTPLEPLELQSGEYAIVVRAERYEEHASTVAIEGQGKAQTLEVRLVPKWARVQLDSSPGGALVSIDGVRAGATPLTAELLEGRHRVDWSLPGYEPQSRTITVTANEPLTVPPVTLDPADARLVVQSSPPDATITVDGTFRGTTPAELFVEPGADHAVTLSKVGYETLTRTVRLGTGETVTLPLELVALEGTLELAVWPADAELIVDGKSLGAAGSRVLQLDAVPHQVEIRKAGYEPFVTNVTPRPGLPQTLRVTLKTPAEIFKETTPRLIRTGQGQELRLVEGGNFRMGAPRREPGRRSNEVERDVEITRPFYVATMEVTNRQFREFAATHLSGRVGDFSLEMDHHPAVRVRWDDAAAYCNWLSQREGLEPVYVKSGGRMVAAKPLTNGYRLPTEAEWEWIARFPDGVTEQKYPWGQALPIAPGSGNYADVSSLAVLTNALADYVDDYPVTAPVDAFPPNAQGLFNLGGNVSEWTHDLYAINPDAEGLEQDPTGPTEGDFHVVRGSSWMDATVSELRLTYRDYGSDGQPDIGFRIARWVTAPVAPAPAKE
jgi:formylglycine-generating enzyme required for sulfatase activity